jgi:mRNA-degrading endonuclease toxin of MazEF toxin-antitoxin module
LIASLDTGISSATASSSQIKEICDDPDWPLVLIAPLTHQLFPKPKADLLVDVTEKNGLVVPSRLILSQIQPLQKISLKERLGEISVTKWEQILKQVFWHMKRR